MRPACARCRRPSVDCICEGLLRIRNATQVVILQHPRERRHPFGSAAFAELGLARVDVHVHHGLSRAPSPLPALQGAALVYPRPGAPLLGPEHAPRTLVFVDGTWSQAQTLLRINPRLDDLPCYRLEPSVLDRYRIRGEPAPHCMSTLEAIAAALSIVEPDLEGLDALLLRFDAMVARQLALRADPHPRLRNAPKPKARPIPRAFLDAEDVVLAYAEVSKAPDERREILYLVALEISGSRFFACAARPAHRPSDAKVASAGLTHEMIEDGVPQAELLERWRTFRGSSVVAAWSQSTVDRLGADVMLKAAYTNLTSSPSGAIEDVLEREGLERVTTPFIGRAGAVMGALVPIARWLRLTPRSGCDRRRGPGAPPETSRHPRGPSPG